MCKINSSEQNILSYKCNDLKFSEHEFNSALLVNFVSTNLFFFGIPARTHAHKIRTFSDELRTLAQ